METIKNNKGIAMVMVLILAAVVLSLTAGLIYIITQGTIMSGSQKRYATAVEAGYGGLEIFQQMIDDRGVLTVAFFGIALDSSLDTCLDDKLNRDTADWNTAALPPGHCATNRRDFDPTNVPDMNLTLGDYDVDVKIVDTSIGNSNTSTQLLGGSGVVNSNAGLITPPPVPYLYRVNIRAQRTDGPAERADITGVYAY